MRFRGCYNEGWHVIHAYLGYNIVAIQKQLTGIASLIKEMLEQIPACVIDSAQ
jgi:hypothetical protein